ncbi:hypothetical protein V5799_031997 [Amblyomma americanum]|uniref:Uncharacterized protein n=1 Tax=Amblyomma americanum TaxID=6943 RepID=A0AAQ4DSE9_AMBAM
MVRVPPHEVTNNAIRESGWKTVAVESEKWRGPSGNRNGALVHTAEHSNHGEFLEEDALVHQLGNRTNPAFNPSGVRKLRLPLIRQNTPEVMLKGSSKHNASNIHRSDSLVNVTAKVDKGVEAENGKPSAPQTNQTVLPKIPEEYAIVDPVKKKRILILAYFRSGSSFLGGLLSSASNMTFFSYEPLSLLTPAERLDSRMSSTGLDILENHLTCQFPRMSDYLATAFRRWNHYTPNAFLMKLCGRKTKVCLNSQFMADVCRRSPFQVIKVTRLSVSDVLQRLQMNASLTNNLKVLHLVRDPRGMLSSRSSMSWCRKSKTCLQAKYLCHEIEEDLDAFEQLRHLLPNGTVRLRYEDIASWPFNESMVLFQALGLEFSDVVRDFLRTHTTTDDEKVLRNPYSTVRRSNVTVFKWTKKLDWERVKEIQTVCAGVLKRLGYQVFGSYEELKKMSP